MPRKIAIVTTHPIQYQVPWFRGLAAHPDLDVEVFFCHKATPAEQAAAGFGVQFEWDIPLYEGYPYRFLKNVARNPSISTFRGLDTPGIAHIIAKGRYNAVIVSGWNYKSAWQAILGSWRTRTPVMVRGDTHLYYQRHPLKKTAKWLAYRRFIPRLDACLAVGKWSREYYIHYGARPDRVFIVPHVINDEAFACESNRLQEHRPTLRRQWGLEEDATVYLFSGKLIERKRPLDFIRAVGKAARWGAPVAGLVVGDGPLRQACEEVAWEMAAPVRFAGFLNQSQIVASYVAADALVLPSDARETWGLVVNEAMACGRSCFVSDQVGCGPDMIIPGSTGHIFPMGDVDALAELLMHATQPGTLITMGEHARSKAKESRVDAAVQGVMQALVALEARS
ncbi:MAG TPA: glycosyltransferase family 4 protein [Chloroflexia bacterium]|nr:glycosyltransferase family 4 protein [Chloroflexia bacterium]